MAFKVRSLSNFNSITKLFKELVSTFHSAEGALTADTGSAQNDSYAITKAISRFTTVGTAGDSAILPAATAGRVCIVFNKAAANSMDVFPASGDAINALSADAAYALAATKGVIFACATDGQWDTILTA